MSKRPLVIFGLFAVFFAILIPLWAISKEGGEEASPQDVPAGLEEGKELFLTNCGACHTLAKAGTDGVVGPNLDDLLAPAGTPPNPDANRTRVLLAVQNGAAGRMPADILTGRDAETVADFVAAVAGTGK